jgi:hypothetical protein
MTMEDDRSTLPTSKRTPWNRGKLVGAKPPLLARHALPDWLSALCATPILARLLAPDLLEFYQWLRHGASILNELSALLG